MRVVVLGASGLIGKNLLAAVPKSWDIVATYRSDESFPSYVKSLHSSNISTRRCDLLNPDDLKNFRSKYGVDYDLCIFLAANSDPSKSYIDPAFDLQNNTETLINFLQKFNVKRFMFLSSGAVYEGLEGVVSPNMALSPTLPYAVSKLAAEAYVKHFKKKGAFSEYLIVRFFGAYGPYEHPRKIYTKLVKQFHSAHNPKFTIRGDGKNLIDAMYVEDAVEGILRMASCPFEDSTIDFCSGKPISIRELVTCAAQIFEIRNPQIAQEGETSEYIRFFADPSPFMKRFDFKPKVDLTEGLKRLALFLEENRQ